MPNTTAYKIIIFLLLAAATPSYASEQLYKIEVLVFAQNGVNSELLGHNKSQIDWPAKLIARDFFPSATPTNIVLYQHYQTLLTQENYLPLLHDSWQQKIAKNSLSTAVQIDNPTATLNGYFRIQRGNLIHLIADLEYTPPSTATIYRLQQKRRFKLDETHYLDHPKLGMLVHISVLTPSKTTR